MRFLHSIPVVFLSTMFFVGCSQNAVSPQVGSGLAIRAVAASKTVVGPGASTTILCTVDGAVAGKLNYDWTVSGTYGYIYPMDSVCIFASPGCHSGSAKVSVTVSDESGAAVNGSVDINAAQ